MTYRVQIPVPARVVVLVSGSGTLLQALLDAAAEPGFPARVVAVGADRTDIEGLVRAERRAVPTFGLRVADHVDRAAWDDRLRRISAVFKTYPEVFDSQIKLSVNHQTRYVVTTEGTELITERLIYGIHVAAEGRAPDGLLVSHFRSLYGASEAEMRRNMRELRNFARPGRPRAGRSLHRCPVAQ